MVSSSSICLEHVGPPRQWRPDEIRFTADSTGAVPLNFTILVQGTQKIFKEGIAVFQQDGDRGFRPVADGRPQSGGDTHGHDAAER